MTEPGLDPKQGSWSGGGQNDSQKEAPEDGHIHLFHIAAACKSHCTVCVPTCTHIDSHVASCALAHAAISHPHIPMDRYLWLSPGPSIHQSNTAVFLCTIPLPVMAAIL